MLLIFSDIAGSEILLILAFVLIFFGAKSIPGMARTLGRTMRQVREASQDMQNEIRKSGADMKKDLNLKGLISDTEQTIRQPLDQMSNNINDIVDSSRKPYNPVTPPPVTASEPIPEQFPDDTEPKEADSSGDKVG